MRESNVKLKMTIGPFLQNYCQYLVILLVWPGFGERFKIRNTYISQLLYICINLHINIDLIFFYCFTGEKEEPI